MMQQAGAHSPKLATSKAGKCMCYQGIMSCMRACVSVHSELQQSHNEQAMVCAPWSCSPCSICMP